MDKSPKKPKSSKKKIRVEDLPVKDAGKIQGGARIEKNWDLEKNE